MKMYTAQEMRVRADYLEGALADAKTAAMLRQAADMMEREATSEKSSQVCNAAKMREALSLALAFANGMYNTTKSDVYLKLAETIEESLAAQTRNCDRYTIAEALRKYGFPTKSNPWGEKEWLDFCEWLFDEAKGSTDGSK